MGAYWWLQKTEQCYLGKLTPGEAHLIIAREIVIFSGTFADFELDTLYVIEKVELSCASSAHAFFFPGALQVTFCQKLYAVYS